MNLVTGEHRSTGGRFQDPRTHLWDYMGHIAVRCPRCGSRARVAPDLSAEPAEHPEHTARRLTCLTCHHSVEQKQGVDIRIGAEGRDPYFGLELWFTTDCGEHVLWAYNEAHLELLESYVKASLRDRGRSSVGEKTSLIERLPSWLKYAKNRDAIGRSLARLRALAG